MASIHIQKRLYDGYCVGVGVEYPNIIVGAKNDEELIRRFKESITSYERAMKKYNGK